MIHDYGEDKPHCPVFFHAALFFVLFVMTDKNNIDHITDITPETVAKLLADLESLESFNTDVTQAGHELIAAQTRLHALLHNASDGVITLNPDGTAQSFNLAAQQIFGYSEGEIITSKISHLVPCPDWANDNVTDYLRSFISDRDSDDIPLVGVHKDGHEILLHVSLSEVVNEEVELFGDDFFDIDDAVADNAFDEPIVCFFHDVTSNKRIEKELESHKSAFDRMAGIIVRNADFSLYSVNGKMAEFMNMTVEELMADPELLSPFSHPETHFSDAMKTTLIKDEFWQGEVCFHTKLGELKWFSQSITTLKDDDAISQYHLILFDITERKHKEQETNARQSALDLTTSVSVTDADGKITYVNDKFCALTQYSREELLGQDHRVLNSGHHSEMFWKDMYGVASTGKPWRNKVCNKAKDGSIYWLDTTVIGFHNEQGDLERYVAIRTDITTQKILEQNLQYVVDEQTKELRAAAEVAHQAREEAEAANHAKSDFLANMSHELRTPMHSILSFSDFGLKQITKTPLEEKGIEKIERFFSNINESGKRLLGLLNDLLDLAKLEAGKMTYNFKKQDLRVTTEKILTEFSTKLIEKNVDVKFLSPKNTLAHYDHDKISQVIANLISNAIKFTEQGSEIRIVLENTDVIRDAGTGEKVSVLKFSIFDQGLGVPEGELEAIFDQFIQSSKTKTGAGGTGLGLAICKEIIEAHKGYIWAENNPEGGAEVSFIIHKS
ncbi:hypothetical protein A9Q79_08710 [Methylophaga sp. 42_25_T18]|nr:hypothetical protein A9Q79_08710 [Methylophaga sp. 42_25_T18]